MSRTNVVTPPSAPRRRACSRATLERLPTSASTGPEPSCGRGAPPGRGRSPNAAGKWRASPPEPTQITGRRSCAPASAIRRRSSSSSASQTATCIPRSARAENAETSAFARERTASRATDSAARPAARSIATGSAGPVIPDLRHTSLSSSGTPLTRTRPARVVRPVPGNAGASRTMGVAPERRSAAARNVASSSAATCPRSVESIFLYRAAVPLR